MEGLQGFKYIVFPKMINTKNLASDLELALIFCQISYYLLTFSFFAKLLTFFFTYRDVFQNEVANKIIIDI